MPMTSGLLSLLLVGGIALPACTAARVDRHGPAATAAYTALAAASRWGQQAELAARDGAPGDHFGGPVALSGRTALIGAWDRARGTGASYLFTQVGGRWTQQARLTARGGGPGDWFGASVALSGDTALVGAPLAGTSGAAYVFVRHGSQVTVQATLTPAGASTAAWFGRSVALSGDTALIGAWYDHGAAGAAYVFVRQGNQWHEQERLTAGDGIPEEYFGTAVALQGNTALIGAAGRDDNAGAAYLFVRSGDQWRQQAMLTARESHAGDAFGTSVSLSAGTALVGAGFAHHNTGAAYVFVQRGTRWAQQAELIASDGQSGDWFGRSATIDGDMALVGAWYAHRHAGVAYVFVRRGSQWVEQATLQAPDGSADDSFGGSVALQGGIGLIGAGFRHHAAGAVYVFKCISWPVTCSS